PCPSDSDDQAVTAADLIADGPRRLACQSLTSDVIRIAERVPLSVRYVNPRSKDDHADTADHDDRPGAESRRSGAGNLRPIVQRRPAANEVRAHVLGADDWRLDRLIGRLPTRLRPTIRFLREPSRRWLRIPMGLLLTFGGVL